jgi:7,8-dihydropterin-6-yl-methyl-4-(beta-D-ribofuranosyl)aminobenzene 5'-phosphate synthase
LRVTVLVENTADKQGLLGEHGLAFWIETGAHRVLFDTGQGQALAPNASCLRVDLSRADAIVLSHGHYDHTGGLCCALNRARNAKLFLHPQALVCRYAGGRGRAREIGLASVTRQAFRQEARRLVWTSRPSEVVPGVHVTGVIPRRTDYEKTSGEFFLDAGCRVPDPISDDQALYVDTRSGVVVILGCAHAGVVNTLRYISAMTHRPIHAVIGGTHLVNASPRKIARTLSALRGMRLRVIAPAHCTGPRATAAFWNAFPQQVADCSVGTQWTFPGLPSSRRAPRT